MNAPYGNYRRETMNARTTDLKKLEIYYEKSGNQMLLLYGRRGCQKED